MKKTIVIAALVAIAAAVSSAEGQGTRDPNCSYERCALGLAPVWNGLAVTRGESETQVELLGFFWPGDVTHAFSADKEAADAARDAMRVRQVGAILTDGGIVLAATGIARALFRRDWDKLSTGLTISGAAALGASVPFQFGADGYLSRAVWLFNRRYAR